MALSLIFNIVLSQWCISVGTPLGVYGGSDGTQDDISVGAIVHAFVDNCDCECVCSFVGKSNDTSVNNCDNETVETSVGALVIESLDVFHGESIYIH